MTEIQERLPKLICNLVGENITLPSIDYSLLQISDESFDLGFSQMNEILLLHGFDRVSKEFFQYLVDQTTIYKPKARIKSLAQLEKGIDEFRKLSILWWGNIKKGFKTFARDSPDYFLFVLDCLKAVEPEVFAQRHRPILEIKEISPHETYLLGYLVRNELKDKLLQNPNDPDSIETEKRRQNVVGIGMQNHKAYLSSDHLDIYIATSMRQRHEYVCINKTIKNIFSNHNVNQLNLRYFDPTQAFCESRIDKGLSEGLMLKRAKCTLYLAQESDTLGKDSELAATLAQGKPVIVYIPEVTEESARNLIQELKESYPEQTERSIILGQLEVFKPSLTWGSTADCQKVKTWLGNPESGDLAEMTDLLFQVVKNHYDRRASTFKNDHPLGLQVNLETGVATGVLVVRNIEDCAKLIKAVVLKQIVFNLQSGDDRHNPDDIYLRESISGSIFRVISGDKLLTNAFWNFYLDTNQL